MWVSTVLHEKKKNTVKYPKTDIRKKCIMKSLPYCPAIIKPHLKSPNPPTTYSSMPFSCVEEKYEKLSKPSNKVGGCGRHVSTLLKSNRAL